VETSTTKWRQIGGDMTWESHGVVLAKNEAEYEQVHLVRILPWMEHDMEAAVSHGLYLVDEKTVDYGDLAIDQKHVRDALRSVGMDPAEWANLAPEHQAEVLASHDGYDESRSVDRLADALPDAPEDIEFWGQKETAETLESYDDQMRREALDANFETRFTFGEMPPMDAIEFALGGEEFELELQGQDALAFAYGTAVAGISGDTATAEEFAATVQALAETPAPAELPDDVAESSVERVLTDWEERYGDPSEEDHGIASVAQRIASDMLAAIGFEWV
jgi:hypothetical protein